MRNINIIIHRYEFFPAWVFGNRLTSAFLTPTFHDRHHECYNVNYGGFFTWWDDICGTADGTDWRERYGRWRRDGRREDEVRRAKST